MGDNLPALKENKDLALFETVEDAVGFIIKTDKSFKCKFCGCERFDYLFNALMAYFDTSIGPGATLEILVGNKTQKKDTRLYRCKQCGTIYRLKSRTYYDAEFEVMGSARQAHNVVGKLLLEGT